MCNINAIFLLYIKFKVQSRDIKCLDNYIKLKKNFEEGYKRDIGFFCERINVSKRTFHRLIKYMHLINGYNVKYNKQTVCYYLDHF